MPQIKFDRELFNDFVYNYILFNESRYLVERGSAGSGKSVGAAQKIIMRTVSERNHRFVLTRKFGNTIRKSQYKLLCDYIRNYNLTELFNIRDTDMTITCPSTSSEIIACGVDEPEKIKSLADPTGIWYEEPTELTPQEFRQMSLRLRGDREFYKQEILTFNPISEMHWIRDEFFPPEIEQAVNGNWKEGQGGSATMIKYLDVGGGKKVPFQSTMVHSTYMDNKFIDDEYKAILLDLKDKDPYFYQVYCLGQWGVMGELVFHRPWEIKTEFPEEFDYTMYGFDWGYHHPSALVKVGIKDTEYYVQEKLYQNKTTRENLIRQIAEEGLIEDTNDIIFYDSAEPELKEIFDDYKLNARPSMKGKNSVMAGLDYMKNAKIYSHPENINLNKELQTYKWAVDKDEKPIEGKVLKINDDCIDAARYPIYTHSRLSEPRVGFSN